MHHNASQYANAVGNTAQGAGSHSASRRCGTHTPPGYRADSCARLRRVASVKGPRDAVHDRPVSTRDGGPGCEWCREQLGRERVCEDEQLNSVRVREDEQLIGRHAWRDGCVALSRLIALSRNLRPPFSSSPVAHRAPASAVRPRLARASSTHAAHRKRLERLPPVAAHRGQHRRI